ncbi:hypothetical protein BH10BAC2_BH10BAC2_18300 [soil metagenome]
MSSETIIKYLLLVTIVIIYIIYTIRYSIFFNKSILFSKPIKAFHLFMFWIIPFIWIFLIRSITKSTPGSHEIKKKQDNEPHFDAYRID